ncbi:MAG TPA: hypothetical protein VMB50_08630 [Myxococcales bacterium]|nr:hypothetical protein [Myxococcales bacterium]
MNDVALSINPEEAAPELRQLAELRRSSPGGAALKQQAAFAARYRASPAALELAVQRLLPAGADGDGLAGTLAARLAGTARGGPVEQQRWERLLNGLATQAFLAWAPDALAVLASADLPAAAAGAKQLAALVDQVRGAPAAQDLASFDALCDGMDELSLVLLEAEDQLDEALVKAGVEVGDWYEDDVPPAPDLELPPRGALRLASLSSVGLTDALSDLAELACHGPVFAEVRNGHARTSDLETLHRRIAAALGQRMDRVLTELFEAVLAIDGPAGTPLAYRIREALSDPAPLWALIAAAVTAGVGWYLASRR